MLKSGDLSLFNHPTRGTGLREALCCEDGDFRASSKHFCSAPQINLVSKGVRFHGLPSPLLPLQKTLFLMAYQDGALHFVIACLVAMPHSFCFQLLGCTLKGLISWRHSLHLPCAAFLCGPARVFLDAGLAHIYFLSP